MKNLRELSNHELLTETLLHVSKEKEHGIEVLKRLQENERRRLYAQGGYSSLFEYCVDVLKYSKGAAKRRVDAVRLMREIPEIETALRENKTNLTNISIVQDFFKAERKAKKVYSPEKKKEIFESVGAKSTRECQKILFSISPQAIPREQEKVVSETETELKLIVSDAFLEKLKRFRDQTAHKNASAKISELLEQALDVALTVKQKKIGSAPNQKCSFENTRTGKKCESTFALEGDHIIPRAKGGSNEPKNLRLLCRTHNELEAIRHFGREKMSNYLSGLNPN